MTYLSVKNWGKFQNFADGRNIIWLRLYVEIISEYKSDASRNEIRELNDAQFRLLVSLWCLAAKFKNRIPNDPNWIEKETGATCKKNLQVLIAQGFIELNQEACNNLVTNLLQPCNKTVTGELELELERERELDQEKTTPKPPSCEPVLQVPPQPTPSSESSLTDGFLFEPDSSQSKKAPRMPYTPSEVQNAITTAWNEMVGVAAKRGAKISKIMCWTAKRKSSLAERLKDPWWRDNWKSAIDAIPKSPFLRGENDRGWTANLDWFLRPDSVARALEGNYRDDDGVFAGNEEVNF